MKTKFDGPKLILPDWNFDKPSPRTPNRRHILAQHYADKLDYFVLCNHARNLFWVKAVGPGLAGNQSRRSHTVTTRSQALAQLWIEAVKSGNVAVE